MTTTHPDDDRPGPATDHGRKVGGFSPWNLLLIVPLVGTLFPMLYNRVEPSIGGMPFFYWYQLAWVPISVVFTVAVYLRTRGDRS